MRNQKSRADRGPSGTSSPQRGRSPPHSPYCPPPCAARQLGGSSHPGGRGRPPPGPTTAARRGPRPPQHCRHPNRQLAGHHRSLAAESGAHHPGRARATPLALANGLDPPPRARARPLALNHHPVDRLDQPPDLAPYPPPPIQPIQGRPTHSDRGTNARIHW